MAHVIWLLISYILLFVRLRNFIVFYIRLFPHCQYCFYFWVPIRVERGCFYLVYRWVWEILLTILWVIITRIILLVIIIIILVFIWFIFISIRCLISLVIKLKFYWSLDYSRMPRWMRNNKNLFRALSKLVNLIF